MRTSAPDPVGAGGRGASVMRMGKSTVGVWLGLFAMLMLHLGPLYSALNSEPPVAVAMPAASGDDPSFCGEPAAAAGIAHLHHEPAPSAGDEPAWLQALTMCGYCELLTLNPPLALSLDLSLPYYAPAFFLPLPEKPLPAPPRRAGGHPRAPPILHA